MLPEVGCLMFKIGETVIHPRLGACQVKQIVTHSILGEEQRCLVLVPLFENYNNLKITLPVKNSQEVGLRKPVTLQAVEAIKAFLSQKIDGSQVNGQEVSLPSLRNKLASGDPQQIAEAIRDLQAKVTQDGGKYASARRTSFLQEAKECLAREVSISTGLTIEEVSVKIYSILEI